jgi:thiol-disulfide isomerase/thioredoxin
MIDIRLSGGTIASLPLTAKDSTTAASLPDVAMTTVDGANFRFSDLRGRPLLVEFWAPWCPHCLDTLTWMKKFDRSRVDIVAVAIDAPAADIDSAVKKLGIPGRIAIGTDAVRDAFGGPPAVPTLLVADRKGKIVRIFYGASPALHADIDRLLKTL